MTISELFRKLPPFREKGHLRLHEGILIREYEDSSDAIEIANLMKKISVPNLNVARFMGFTKERDFGYISMSFLPYPNLAELSQEDRAAAFPLWQDEVRKLLALGITPYDSSCACNVLFDASQNRVFLIDYDCWQPCVDKKYLASVSELSL